MPALMYDICLLGLLVDCSHAASVYGEHAGFVLIPDLGVTFANNDFWHVAERRSSVQASSFAATTCLLGKQKGAADLACHCIRVCSAFRVHNTGLEVPICCTCSDAADANFRRIQD